MSSNLMKTSFKNEESGGSINKYITIWAIQAIDTTNLSKRSTMNIDYYSVNSLAQANKKK